MWTGTTANDRKRQLKALPCVLPCAAELRKDASQWTGPAGTCARACTLLAHVGALSQAADFQSLDDLTKTHAAQNGEYKRLSAILRDLERQHANDEHTRSHIARMLDTDRDVLMQ